MSRWFSGLVETGGHDLHTFDPKIPQPPIISLSVYFW